jgi:hypothetical protein
MVHVIPLLAFIEIGRGKAKRKRKSRGDGKWGPRVGSRRDFDSLELIVLGIRYVSFLLFTSSAYGRFELY